ncbi:MAG: biotin/lipoyl-binding protein, partial [Plesiomonas sp.]
MTGGLLVVAVLTAGYLMFNTPDEKYALRLATAEEGELELSVTASGNIQPVTKVDVGTQVSGIVTKIFVDFNSQVKAGQLLAELDKSTLSERVNQAKAALENAE